MALAIAPTRELALQVSEELAWLYRPAGARIATCVGGMDPRKEQRALAVGAHIVVGTPGRLRDHLERGNLDLSGLRAVVLDEADEMLDMGFREDLEEILDATPADRRTLMFSATIARDIVALAKRYQRDAVRIDTISRDTPHGDIDYRAIRVAPNDVEHAVVNVLRFFESPGALVFCNTRDAVRHLHGSLRERGFSVVGLSGELTQKERADALQALRDGRARVCVATDVAARGLDLPDLGLVIHADLPVNKAGLLHRSGRTGRAGRKGTSVLLVPYTRRRKAEQLLLSASIEAAWAGPPTAEEIRAGDQARLLADPLLTQAASEEDLALAKILLASSTPEQIAAALIRQHRARLPSPEDMFDDPRMRDAQEADRGRPDRGRPDRDDRGDRPERGERPERMAPEDVVWFRASIGRQNNADPKWLIPLICRLGHVTKKDIGQIRIFDRETKFEISKAAQDRFTTAVRAAAEGDIRIEPAGPPGPNDRPGPRFKPPTHAAKIHAPKPRPDKPRPDKPRPDGFKPRAEGYKGRTEGSYKPRTEGHKPRPDGAKPRPPFKGPDKNKGKPKRKSNDGS
jgi:ATP-dependent RNA helicase DeaD